MMRQDALENIISASNAFIQDIKSRTGIYDDHYYDYYYSVSDRLLTICLPASGWKSIDED